MEIIIEREYHPNGTNGQLSIAGKKVCSTIELPWKNNKRRISCIPEGRYQLVKRYTPRFGDHLLVGNVPNRDAIIIHAANNALLEIKGCIAPVTSLTGIGKGSLSRLALKKLMTLLLPALSTAQPVFLIIKEKTK